MVDKKVEVTSIGTLAVDYYAILEKIPELDQKIMAESYEEHPGGVAGNVITQVARLGISTGWIGKIGDDSSGDILVEQFLKDGIDFSHTERISGKKSMFTWILIDNQGKRTITMFPNILSDFTGEDIRQKHTNYIKNSRVLLTEACVLPLEPVITAMEIARNAGVTTIFDLDVKPSDIEIMKMGSRDDLERILSLTDILIPCKVAAAELLGTDEIGDNITDLLRYDIQTVAVTLGKKGCIAIDRNKPLIRIPEFPVKVVDTTGAGDAFHGGFVYGVLQKWPLKRIASFANACGALCCRKVGARSSATLAEVEKFININKNI